MIQHYFASPEGSTEVDEGASLSFWIHMYSLPPTVIHNRSSEIVPQINVTDIKTDGNIKIATA